MISQLSGTVSAGSLLTWDLDLLTRKEANIHKMINIISAIKSVENINQILYILLPALHTNTRVIPSKTEHNISEQIFLDIPNLDYSTQAYLYVSRDGNMKMPEKYVWPKDVAMSVANIINKVSLSESHLIW